MGQEIVRAVAHKRDLRYVVVINTETVADVARRHKVTGADLTPLGSVMSGTQLLATLLKGAGTLTCKVDSDGALPWIAADATPLGLVRATLRRAAADDESSDLGTPLIGDGTLTVEKRLVEGGSGYRGIVELVSPQIAPSLAYYLEKSEQIRSCIGLSTTFDHTGVVSSGGFMIQVFPGTEERSIELVEEQINSLESINELFPRGVTADDVLKRLAGDDVDLQIMSRHPVTFHCPCTRERSLKALVALGRDELEAMLADGGEIAMSCDYCKEPYAFNADEVRSLFEDS